MEKLKLIGEGVLAGLLALLWLDVRKVRSFKSAILDEADKKFLPRDKHEDICKIACLEMKNYVKDTVADSEARIITEIKKTNGGHS